MTTYLYIDKSGTVRGSLVAPPEKPEHTKENRSDLREYFRDPNDNLQAEKEYYTALQSWKKSCIEFEDQADIKDLIPWKYHGYHGRFLVETLSLDLEVEEVEQMRPVSGFRVPPPWIDRVGRPEAGRNNGSMEYRTILRIKK